MKSLAERKRELIAAVTRQVRTAIEDGGAANAGPASSEPALAEPFVERCLEGVALDDLYDVGVERLGELSLSLLAWVRRRAPGELLLRVFNPTREEHGFEVDRTAIEILCDDRPFLVDSLTGALNQRELTTHLAIHPQLTVRRDDDGKLLEIVPRGAGGEAVADESLMHLEIDLLVEPAALVELETGLHKVLEDVRSAVEDWLPMRDAADRALKELVERPTPFAADEINEAVEFLRWVRGDHFTFLGFLEFSLEQEDDDLYLRPVETSGLGLSRKLSLGERVSYERPVAPAERRFLEAAEVIAISKTLAQATVHRNVPMDLISVKRFDAEGRLLGIYRFMGLFTSMAYSIAARAIPLVRRKVARVVDRTRFLPTGHDAKALRHIVEHYPRDELFQISEDDLYRFALRILELQLRPRLALLVRRDEEERFVSCMVYVPRERHSTDLRIKMQRVLERAYGGKATTFSTRISDRPLAQVQFVIPTRTGEPLPDREAIEAQLTEVAKSWQERLREELEADPGNDDALSAWKRYRRAFPSSFQETFEPQEAVADIAIVDRVLESGRLGMRLYRREGAAISRLHFRTFELAVPAPLTEILPQLENMGLKVNTEIPYDVRPAGAANPVWIRDFELQVEDFEVDPSTVREIFEDAVSRVWTGEVENDGFNQLVLRAGLDWRQVVVLRAYCKYLRQTGIAFSQRYMADVLGRHARVARLLVDLFETTFDPDRARAPEACEALHRKILAALEKIRHRDHDRVLRRYLNLVRSTLRTNYYQRDEDGEPKPYLSFKLDAVRVLDLPEPRPAIEIFVYAPWVEAVHLRGGKVARGGIRWSDRRADFRTEVLGLMKAQMVKNAVIVPVGAKGGFVVKRPPASGLRDEIQAEGVHCYKTMIRGLLDLTDNLGGGQAEEKRVVAPERTVCLDDDDPYLVVAADKGTATFSDLANGVAAEYGYWLGDAFASGGSVGYDHKQMGITARGAWESVKRHFRELGTDIQTEPFTAVGVGDMSGDVFGNGMLLSEQTKLLAAFNHLHVFVDPDPDPRASHWERKRLFERARSSWADYDRDALSAGGGVFERREKQITVSPEVQERFGLADDTLTPDELIRAILLAKVDLLWFGGIGTYVKARHETHAEVGDRANDELRVDGGQLGCRVIGEGANLALTQAARVEAALTGIRLNTDFIDNSGGVDCSDHEVNIKIALDDAVRRGDLEAAEREPLLVEMTDEVADLVLRDNYLQAQAISITESQAAAVLDQHVRLIRRFEREGLLDRELEGLPDEEGLARRRDKKQGLTRPEIAVLLAYSKIYVFNQLLDSHLPDDVLLREDLVRYFPLPMQWRLRPALERHRLRREIIATHVTNSIINRVGPAFVVRLADETGSRTSDIARAYAAVREIFALRLLWEEIEDLDGRVAAELQVEMHVDSIRMIERATRWFLRYAGRPLDVTACVARYEQDIIVVAAQLEDLLPPNARGRVRRRYRRLCDQQVPESLASRLASIALQPAACDVARCAQVSGEPVERVGKLYFALGERFGFDRLRYGAGKLRSDNPWHQVAVTAAIDDLFSLQAELARQVVSHPGKTKAAIDAWRSAHRELAAPADAKLKEIRAVSRIDLARLTVAERELRRLLEVTAPVYDRNKARED